MAGVSSSIKLSMIFSLSLLNSVLSLINKKLIPVKKQQTKKKHTHHLLSRIAETPHCTRVHPGKTVAEGKNCTYKVLYKEKNINMGMIQI
jgi:hypothetical protein